MNSKLFECFTYDLNLPLKNIFFQFLSTALRKLTANDKNQEILSINKHLKLQPQAEDKPSPDKSSCCLVEEEFMES